MLEAMEGSSGLACGGHAVATVGPSTASGPISITASTPMSASVWTQARNATGARAWLRQYRPSSAVPASRASPVMLLTYVTDGATVSIPSTTASRSSRAGSTSAL